MNFPALGWALLGGAAAWFIPDVLSRWQAWRILRNVLARLDHPERFPPLPPRKPESLFVVHLSEAGIRCERPGGPTEQITWGDIQRVEVVTTSDGPFLPDVFWVLSGTTSGCLVPQGATGERILSKRLGQLPGFDHKAVVRAMGCTDDAHFLCWQRTI